jgi:hypothetical protein
MKAKTFSKLLIIVLFVNCLIGLPPLPVRGLPENQTQAITFTDDDGFVLETGAMLFETGLVTVKDPNQDIRAFLVFRQIEINGWETLQNATLRLRTASSQPFDADNFFTIYGVKDGEFNGFSSAAHIVTAPLTGQSVTYNASQFSGSTWWEIDVSSIVEELKSQPSYTGDEVTSGTFGFIILGAEGDDTRWFYDFSSGNGYQAQIVIHWGDEPDEPPPSQKPPAANGSDQVWVYVNTTPAHIPDPDPTDNSTFPQDVEVDIFRVEDLGDPEIQVVDSNTLAYFNTTKGNPNFNDWAGTSTFNFQNAGCAEFIATRGDWTFLVGQNGSSIFIYYSDDEFQTWRSDRVNDDFTGLAGHGSDYGSIWADQNGSALIHLVWSTFSDWNNIVYDIVYSNFTLNPVTLNLTWSPTYFNVTEDYVTSQRDADMYQEQDGTIHVTWTGVNGTVNDIQQYRRRQANGTWLRAVRLSSDDTQDAFEGDVVANENTGVAMVAWTQLQAGNWRIKWDTVFPNNTVGTAVGSTDRSVTDARYVSMVNDRTTNVAHMAYQEDSDLQINYRNRTIDNSTSWSPEDTVSPGAQHLVESVEHSNIMGVFPDIHGSD